MTKPKESHHHDYPEAIAGDKAFIGALLETHPIMKRTIAVENIHEDRWHSGIEPQSYGIVNHHDYHAAAGWLKRVNIIKEKAEKEAS